MAILFGGLRPMPAGSFLASRCLPGGSAGTGRSRSARRRLLLEPLESRVLLSVQTPFDVPEVSAASVVENLAVGGEIRGTVWEDLNANGAWDDGEVGAAGRRVYLDDDLSGGWEFGELDETTGPDGSYAFTGLDPGTYVVAVEPQTSWLQTFPQTEPPEAAVGLGTTVPEMPLPEEPVGIPVGGNVGENGSATNSLVDPSGYVDENALYEWPVPDCLELPPEAVAELEALTELELSEAQATPPAASPPPTGEPPYGATSPDGSEYMIGDVWVTVVLLESNGVVDPSTEDWTSAEIDEVKTEIEEGLGWWEDMLTIAPEVPPLHDLTFHVDFTYADAPVPTQYEPINRPQSDEDLWIDDFLDSVGYNTFRSYTVDVERWNHDQRLANGTHWAFTVFVANSVNDIDGRFSDGQYFAYAYLGGPFLVMTYDNNGWRINRMGQVMAHETGHVFYALDEYAGSHTYDDNSGYYNTQNLNAADGHPDPDSRVDSIMAEYALQNAAYASHTSSPTSLEMIGWKDSDADGIFDVLDVPLQLTGSGVHDRVAGTYEFSGTSTVGVLENQNSRGAGHNITINTVDRVQYKLDNGEWIDGNAYGDYLVSVFQEVPTTTATYQVHFRTIVDQTGVTSPVWSDTVGILPNTHTVELVGDDVVENVIFGTHHVQAAVVDRHVFYNRSSFDKDDPAAGPTDDAAIATDKDALLPAGIASFANYTSYGRGINGIMVDVDELPDGITPEVGSFGFRVGNSSDLNTWTQAPDPITVEVREDAGTDGADRVTIIWADYDIRRQWLEVTVPAENLLLAETDVFYFGNAVGEAGNSPHDAQVTTSDVLLARNNPRNFLDSAEIGFAYDYDRDQRVNSTDVLLARNNQTNFLTRLELINLSGPQQAAAGQAAPSATPTAASLVPAESVSESPGRQGEVAAEPDDFTVLARQEPRDADSKANFLSLSADARNTNAWLDRAAWLYELEWTGTPSRPAGKLALTAATVDILMAANLG